MTAISPTAWLGLAALAGSVSLAIMWLIGRFAPASALAEAPPQDSAIASFLFRNGEMFDHHAGVLPDTDPDVPLTWSVLRTWLEPRFDHLPLTLDELPADRPVTHHPSGAQDTAGLHLHRTGHGTRVTLRDPPHACPAGRHALLMAQRRAEEATQAVQAAPHPIWATSPEGTVQWQNAACRATFASNPPVIDNPGHDGNSLSRISLPPTEARRPVCFEVRSAVSGGDVLHHATDITKIVKAETVQKDFVQTLTKTFAYLTTGLAVFDRKRKLALFNPALVDLTALPAQFLSAQPDLMAFFDNLRDRRVMPEPRSYSSWRNQINEVIESAEGGLYQETWALPNDITYRVTGRPHPDGAVAFLFEDITGEVMLARRFRTQIDLRQSALDGLPDAIMVMGPDGVLSFCNDAASRLLRIDPDGCFADMSVGDLLRVCADALPDAEVWREVGAALRSRGQGETVCRALDSAPGHGLTCRVEPLPGGARMLMLHGHAARASKLPVATTHAG